VDRCGTLDKHDTIDDVGWRSEMTSGAVCLQCIPLLAPAFGSFALNLLVRTLAEWLDQRERETERERACVCVCV
jgi:hypothetical protein